MVENNNEPKWRKAVKVVFAFYELLVRMIFRLIYGKRGKQMPPIRNLLLLESATSLALKIRTRKLSSLDAVNAFIERIHEINPVLNCMVDARFEEARQEAHECDLLLETGTITADELARTKPFFGVPFTTKDCVAVKDLAHTAGLYKRKNKVASEDSDVVRQLRNAGAIPIALTNISELCMWWESYNTIYGRTNNPYDTNRIVGGSSGGEGCMQAAAGSAFGIGSDIGGSIRMPAVFNGVFGHKPTRYIVSNKGQFPEPVNTEQDGFLGIGPMCRRAEDLAPLLRLIAKKEHLADLKLDEPVDIKRINYYYQETDSDAFLVSRVTPDIRALFGKVKTHLEKARKINMRRVEFKLFGKSRDIWLCGMAFDGPQFDEQLSDFNGKINIVWELIKSMFFLSSHTLVALLTALFEKLSPKYGDAKYNEKLEEAQRLRMEISDLLGNNGVLLYPTHPTPAPYHNEPLFKPFNFSYTGIVNILGFPSTHVPMGLNEDGIPIGLQVISNMKNDRLCIAVARELEKAFGGWEPLEIAQ